MDSGKIQVKIELLYKLIEESAPDSREKRQALLKLDEAIMWLERIDWFEEDGGDDDEKEI